MALQLEAIEPFRLSRGQTVTLRLSGADLAEASRLRLMRGRTVYFDQPVRIANGVATVELTVPDEAIEGLYSAVLVDRNQRALVKRNALMILDAHHHDGTHLELPDYFRNWYYVVDTEGIPMKDMGGPVGYVRHPLVATYFAQTYLAMWQQDHARQDALDGFRRLVGWLESGLSEGPAGSLLLRHPFPLKALGLAPGWISGLTQGRLAEVFVEAWKLEADERYLGLAERMCRIMAVPVQNGGLLAEDRLGHVSVEEYSTDPPNWALNGIGSAISSLELVAGFVDMPWADDLIERVCASIDAKIALFDCPDYPGSRVQLAMRYELRLAFSPTSVLTRLMGGCADDLRILAASVHPSLSEPVRLTLPEPTLGRKGRPTIEFQSILDGNRDPLDAAAARGMELCLELEVARAGRLELFVRSRGDEILLAQVDIPAGRQKKRLAFDLAQALPMGVGRVARFDETYHQTNLYWMWQLSRYGRMARIYHVGRRWLFSLLTGQGRLPLAGAAFVTDGLDTRRADRQRTVASASEATRRLPRARAAETELRAITEILGLRNDGAPLRVTHATPEVIAADRPVDVSLFGLGFNGSEAVEARAPDGRSLPLIASARVIGGDELVVSIDPSRASGALPPSIELCIVRPTAASGSGRLLLTVRRDAAARHVDVAGRG